VPPAPPLPLSPSRRLTRRKPFRAGFKVLRAARRAGTRVVAEIARSRPGSSPGVHALDLRTGAAVPVEAVARERGSLDVRLPDRPAGPVLLGLELGDRGLSCRIVPAP
jgi:hypothetical protein